MYYSKYERSFPNTWSSLNDNSDPDIIALIHIPIKLYHFEGVGYYLVILKLLFELSIESVSVVCANYGTSSHTIPSGLP